MFCIQSIERDTHYKHTKLNVITWFCTAYLLYVLSKYELKTMLNKEARKTRGVPSREKSEDFNNLGWRSGDVVSLFYLYLLIFLRYTVE